MEHRLITGGEQYLPFARSRIKAMRATGLKYASQQFEIDGCSVKVRIEPGHEYITLEGSFGELPMDSGVIDLVNVGMNSLDRYAPGALYPTTQSAAYNAPFTKKVTGGYVQPSGASAGQLSGTVKVSGARISGTLQDVVYSFYPRLVKTSPAGVDPATWGPMPEDDSVWAKKYTVNACPASMFTGKCRLYVQAMYGKPLYQRNKVDADGIEHGPTIGDPDIPRATSGGGVRPFITVSGYKGGAPVSIYTSTGLYLDPVTGKHFLINPAGDSVTIYPMVSTKAGELLRRRIKESTSLSPEDREHAEAYVLAYSLPDSSKAITLTGPVNEHINSWSLGYGWHWNRSGTVATLTSFETVIDTTFGQAGTVGATIFYESTRYALSVQILIDEDGGFSATMQRTTEEARVKWYVQRGYACIAEPDWYEGGMVKSTNRFNRGWFDCDAPIYSFYRGDEIQIVRAIVKVRSIAKATQTESGPEFAAPLGSGEMPRLRTLGGGGGWMNTVREYVDELNVSFSCGSKTVSYGAGSGQSDSITFGNKTFTGEGNQGYLFDPPWYVTPIAVGYPSSTGNTGYSTVSVQIDSASRYGIPMAWTFMETVVTTGIYKIGSVEAIAPIYDAEAIFLFEQQYSNELIRDERTTAYTGSGGFMTRTKVGGNYDRYEWASPSGLTSSATVTQHPEDRSVTSTEAAWLVYSGGVAEARADILRNGLADFGGDNFPFGVNVFTSASSTPAVISGYIKQPVNTDRLGELNAMVGWA